MDRNARFDDLSVVYEAHLAARMRYERLYQSLKDSLTSRDVEELLRLGTPGLQRELALHVAASLPVADRLRLFPEFLALASFVHGLTERAQTLILSLPRDWLQVNLRSAIERLLESAGYEQYAAMHALSVKFDPALARSIAQRGLAHADAQIVALCRDYLVCASDEAALHR